MTKHNRKKRRVVTGSKAAPSGYHPSIRSNAHVPCESKLERKALQRLELDPTIKVFREHQTEVIVNGPDGPFRAYPDFEAETIDGDFKIIEVKPARRAADPEIAARLEAIRQHYAAQDTEYIVLTDEELCANGVDCEISELIEFRKPGERDRLLQMPEVMVALGSPLPATLEDLAEDLGSWRMVKALIANDILAIDIRNPLDPHQPVRLH